jgi:hypothetical protein
MRLQLPDDKWVADRRHESQQQVNGQDTAALGARFTVAF